MYRLIYKSRSATGNTWDITNSIMEECLPNNLREEIGGILLVTETHFLQVLEGDFERVNRTFMRIGTDSRHTDIQLVAFHPIEKRLFEQWGMKAIGVFDLTDQTIRHLTAKYGSEEAGIRLPTAEWSALALANDLEHSDNIREWSKT